MVVRSIVGFLELVPIQLKELGRVGITEFSEIGNKTLFGCCLI